MGDSLVEQLQKKAHAALQSQSVEEGMQHLAKAFSLFSQETTHLKSRYDNLQQRYLHVNQQLEQTHSELIAKVTELQKVTQYLTNILKKVTQGIFFINLEGRITIYNDAAGKILGKSVEEIQNHLFWECFSDDLFGFSMKDALDFGLSQRPHFITYTRKDLEKRELEVSTTFIYEGPKEHRGMIVLLRDITETQELQKVALRNNRMKELGEMAAAVAHEIRNPLGGIRGYASLLHRDLAGAENLQEMARHILDGTKALERLVNNVLHYARPMQLEIQTLDMALFLKKLCKFIKADPAYPRDVKIDLHISQSPLTVPFDPDAMRSALFNLMINAFQAMQDGGVLTITLMKNDRYCVLTLSDTGEGIAPKDLEQIFSPFFTTKQNGNGLGLSEAHKIIRTHFGSIDVHSQKNHGTAFTITLPLRR